MAKIAWPLAPTQGTTYTSPAGDLWYFDGCGWINYCCQLPCNIFDGLVLKVSLFEDAVLYFPLAYLEYGSLEVWSLALGSGANTYIRRSLDGWTLLAPGDNGAPQPLATLNGEQYLTPIGSWQVVGAGVDLVEVVCGQTAIYCVSFETDSTGASGPLLQVFDLQGTQLPLYFSFVGGIVWDQEALVWTAVVDDVPVAELPGSETQFPVGEWTLLDPSITSFSTSATACACDPFMDGVTLLLTSDGEGDPTTIYSYLGYDTDTFYSANDSGALTIETTDGGPPYTLTIDGIPIAEAASLSGPWIVEELSPFSVIESVCGSIPTTSVCISVTEISGTSSYSLVRIDAGSGLFYANFGSPYSVFFDQGSSEWTVTVGEAFEPIGTFAGTQADLFNGGEPITTDPDYSIVITEGYCQIP